MPLPIQYEAERLALGDKPKFISAADDGSPTVQVFSRMFGIDAPKLHYTGAHGTISLIGLSADAGGAWVAGVPAADHYPFANRCVAGLNCLRFCCKCAWPHRQASASRRPDLWSRKHCCVRWRTSGRRPLA